MKKEYIQPKSEVINMFPEGGMMQVQTGSGNSEDTIWIPIGMDDSLPDDDFGNQEDQ